jgi:hypothetical protein
LWPRIFFLSCAHRVRLWTHSHWFDDSSRRLKPSCARGSSPPNPVRLALFWLSLFVQLWTILAPAELSRAALPVNILRLWISIYSCVFTFEFSMPSQSVRQGFMCLACKVLSSFLVPTRAPQLSVQHPCVGSPSRVFDSLVSILEFFDCVWCAAGSSRSCLELPNQKLDVSWFKSLSRGVFPNAPTMCSVKCL